ncbi:MAG: hypothetical protein P1R58_13565, partial [bacterium]|nr:hypothetical protein [bacterium]
DGVVIDGGSAGSSLELSGTSSAPLVNIVNSGSGADIKADKFLGLIPDSVWGKDTSDVPAIGSGKIGGQVKDTTDYQGSASGLTAAGVATAVRDTASNRSDIFYGPTASGSGANEVVVWAVDSTTNDTLTGVTIAAYNTAGVMLGNLKTGSAGNVTFNLNDGTYHFLATATGYTFPPDTTAIVGVSSYDTTGVEGDYYSPSAPAGGNLCTVNGFIQDHQETDWAYAKLTFTMPKNVTNSCDSVLLLRRTYQCETNSLGYFEISLLNSPCIDSAKWKVIVTDGGSEKTEPYEFFIPSDSSTYRLFWEPQ